MLIAAALPAQALAGEIRNPILGLQEVEYVETEDQYLNILFAGIDFGKRGYRGSYHKNKIEMCHADAMLVVSLNLDTGSLNLISLPRDTVTYVPGVRGVYKLNGAVNCADTVEEGIERACKAASWLLGGIEISKYCAVDMNAMIALGDAIGGVDYEMDMAYTGSSRRRYVPGMQHLDGLGIMDYMRSRKSASRDGTDIGRSGRQRDLMIAIFSKIRENPGLITNILKVVADEETTILTNIPVTELLGLAPKVLAVNPSEIGSHVMTGYYGSALDYWSFTFTNQKHRREMIREVFGVEAAPLEYVSKDYCAWLEKSGFTALQYIGTARDVLACAQDGGKVSKERLEAYEELIDEAVRAFDQASATTVTPDTNVMISARKKLREEGELLLADMGCEESFVWSSGIKWNDDPRINEYQFAWR